MTPSVLPSGRFGRSTKRATRSRGSSIVAHEVVAIDVRWPIVRFRGWNMSTMSNDSRKAARPTHKHALSRSASGEAGNLFRFWRTTRGASQLELALAIGSSMRHLSFVETGRARPSEDIVIRISEALDVPLRERNALLLAAGYAPIYRQTGLDEPAMADVRQAVQLILDQQEPYPAVVYDRHWNIVSANAATGRFLGLFPGCTAAAQCNGLRLIFHPDGLRPFVENWEEVAWRLIQQVHREAVGHRPDAETKRLLDDLLSYPGVPQRWRVPDLERSPAPTVILGFRHQGRVLRFFSTITTFGTPQDITLQELRIESFFPCDHETRKAMKTLARGAMNGRKPQR